MKDFAEKGFYLGLGLAALTKEKVEELAKDLSARAKMSEEQGRQLAESLHEEGKKARENLGKSIEDTVQMALKRIPWVQKIEALEARVAALEAALAAKASGEKAP